MKKTSTKGGSSAPVKARSKPTAPRVKSSDLLPASSKLPSARVLSTLRHRIASHVFAPGSRLRENELAEEFGVSRARIREAFGALEERGLIVRIANRGAMVTRLDAKQVFEIFDVRERLEGLCAREAAIKAPNGGWDDLVAAFGSPLQRQIADGNFQAYLEALVLLRTQMIAYANNSVAEKMLDFIYDQAQVIARRVVILPGRVELGLKLHRELLAAFVSRDADAAERMKRHIIVTARDQVRQFQQFIL